MIFQNMNNLYKIQNEKLFLELISSQHFVYKKAKIVSYLRFFICIIIPIIISAFLINVEDNNVLAVFAILSFLILCASHVMSFFVDKYKNSAAMLQQEFDCKLFGIDSIIPINEDLTNYYLSKYSEKQYKRKYNWYSDYSLLDKNAAIFYCQKENLRWTTRNTKKFLLMVFCLFLIFVLSILFSFINLGYSLSRFISVIAVASPLVSWLIASAFIVIKEHHMVEDLKKQVAINNELLQRGLLTKKELLIMQTLIYFFRCTKFLIPDFFESLLHKNNQILQSDISKREQQ